MSGQLDTQLTEPAGSLAAQDLNHLLHLDGIPDHLAQRLHRAVVRLAAFGAQQRVIDECRQRGAGLGSTVASSTPSGTPSRNRGPLGR
jgi:hypothetical protein